MSFPLLSTKFFFPTPRPNLVPRPRLIDRLSAGVRGPFTVVSAPAGYGKTTLMSEWHANIGRDFPIAWLSLDVDDNDSNRFLLYLTAALEKIKTGIVNNTNHLFKAPQIPPTEVILTSLINELNVIPYNFALVLDDYHTISNRTIHDVIGFLLDHQPLRMHLIILTRSDPPLPLARLRARNQLVEIRAADLEFNSHEAEIFLSEVMGLKLSASDIAVLETRTEGWIAGLQMAALSMQGRDDSSNFIQSFTGSNRFILDYLAEEVILQQPESIQQFLLQTAILKRLNGSLCDVVTGQSNGKTTLEQIEKANLFLVPLDDERCWYRYHHLFADLLRVRLGQSYPGLETQLHLRAGSWFENEGLTVEAINHMLAAGEHNYAARLVEENTTRLLAQGELHVLMDWIGAIPDELRQTKPWLCIHQAYALTFAGRLAEVPPLLTQGESVQRVIPIVDGEESRTASAETRAYAGAVAAIRAMVAVMSGQDQEAILLARQARDLLPIDSLWDRAATAWALGYALRSQGHLAESRTAFEEQIHLGRAMGNTLTVVTALTDLAHVLRTQGQLCQARKFFEEALNEASQQGARSLGYISRMESGLASVLYEQNELEAAEKLLSEAISHTGQWPNPNHTVYAYALQTRVFLAKGDLQAARKSIEAADHIGKNAALTRLNRRLIEANLIRVCLAFETAGIRLKAGDPLADKTNVIMEKWSGEQVNTTGGMDENAEVAALSTARISLSAGRSEQALSLLEPVTQNAINTGHINTAIVCLVLTAIAHQTRYTNSTKQIIPALAALEDALRLAEPGCYVRVFLDEGRPVQLLLTQWLTQTGESPLKQYAIRLLSHFNAEPYAAIQAEKKVTPNDNLIEPLSQRELEVLNLIATGITNQEIASQLIISRGTVKAHTSSIYRKLDVAHRTEAVARARQLGILP
jgi:LuxR family maltose regulon positive regulatory protein